MQQRSICQRVLYAVQVVCLVVLHINFADVSFVELVVEATLLELSHSTHFVSPVHASSVRVFLVENARGLAAVDILFLAVVVVIIESLLA